MCIARPSPPPARAAWRRSTPSASSKARTKKKGLGIGVEDWGLRIPGLLIPDPYQSLIPNPKSLQGSVDPSAADDDVAVVEDERLPGGDGDLRFVECHRHTRAGEPAHGRGRGPMAMADLRGDA